jgi:hypothetical protein
MARSQPPPDPEFAEMIEVVQTLKAEWAGPGPRPPRAVAHQDPTTGEVTWHLRGWPDQLLYILDALRNAEPAR